MIETAHGDITKANTEAIVCPVNCVGVMGKGVALAVKQAFPEVYWPYWRTCHIGIMNPGQVVTIHRSLPDPRIVFCFATKDSWQEPSKLEWIERGLKKLIPHVTAHDVQSLALPALGCGNGGLRWAEVQPMILTAFSVPEMANRRIVLYEPAEQLPRSKR